MIDSTHVKAHRSASGGKGGEQKQAVGRWRTLTFLGALHCDRLTAPGVFDGPINGDSFQAYVEQQLLPVLKPGDIVVMDNLGSHKSAAIRRMIKSAGARLWYLPPYSPDLNPIEQTFAKIKHWMRAVQKRTVRVPDLFDAIDNDSNVGHRGKRCCKLPPPKIGAQQVRILQ